MGRVYGFGIGPEAGPSCISSNCILLGLFGFLGLFGILSLVPKLSPQDVRHIAKLARLKLSNAEVEKFSTDLTKILEYVDTLNEVDTTNVEPTAQVTGLTMVTREDVVRPSEALKEEILACSPLPIVDDHIQTLSAHG